MKKKTIAILGSTGSIGSTSLEIIKKSNKFKVEVLVVNKNYHKITKQINIFKPNLIVINDEHTYLKIKYKFKKKKLLF